MHWTALLAALAGVAAAAPAPAPLDGAHTHKARDVDTTYPYTGPEIPVGDLVDQTVLGNGTGYRRVRLPPAVTPAPGIKVTNNINVISTAYFPDGALNVHFQTPFGIGGDPVVHWGDRPDKLKRTAKGFTHTYDRTPPCSLADPTQCSQFFHEVRLEGLHPGTTYYYQIPGGNGTTPSHVLSVTTAAKAGDTRPFSIAVLADMGYTNAKDTHARLVDAVQDGAKFVWHGGDISYADQWYGGILPCVLEGPDAWDLCYNGSESTLPGGVIDNDEYYIPVPKGEIPSQGGPFGGDGSTLLESTWDLWQLWMNSVTKHVPYIVGPGNHEAACAEFDGPNNELSAILDDGLPPGSTAPNQTITYYSCPPSQRNFTAYNHRFHMPGDVSGGRSNFWYSFDYGLVHFVTFNGETDYPQSPEAPLPVVQDGNSSHPNKSRSFITNSGPFGRIDGDRFTDPTAYEQYQWLAADLAAVDRRKTPWVFAMSHRPFYSTQTAAYQTRIRAAFEDLFLEHGVDAYISGHIHWYERLWPIGRNGSIQHDNVINNHTYRSVPGSVTHIINGAAGNIESHSVLDDGQTQLPITAVLDTEHYGLNKLTVFNASVALWEFVHAKDGDIGDYVYLVKDKKKKTKHH